MKLTFCLSSFLMCYYNSGKMIRLLADDRFHIIIDHFVIVMLETSVGHLCRKSALAQRQMIVEMGEAYLPRALMTTRIFKVQSTLCIAS